MMEMEVTLVTCVCTSGTAYLGISSEDIDGEALGDESGYSVSLSADGFVVAIGARYNDGNGSYSWSCAFVRVGRLFLEPFGSDIDGEVSNDESGLSVSLSADGSVVAIGAPRNDGNGDNSGSVRIFQWDDSSWNQLGNDIDGEAEGDQSGNSLSLSADGFVVAIGAPYNDDRTGHVRIFQWNGSSWSQLSGS